MKLKIYRQCLENPGTTNAQLFEKFGVTDDTEKQQFVKWKQDCLHCLAVLGEIKKDNKSQWNQISEKESDDLLNILYEKRETLLKLIKEFEGKDGTKLFPKIELTGESKRCTLHLNIDLMRRLKTESDKQKISVSKLVNRLIHCFLEENGNGSTRR